MRAGLPTGTVTFLFSDIEGSTRLLTELGPERYSEALEAHRHVLREAFAARGGVEVDSQGDAFLVAFPTADGAIQAALEAQLALATGPIRVRIGLHAGSPTQSGEGYVGRDVHLGARVAAAAHGGQTIATAAVRELVDRRGMDLRDLGEHRVKDFDAPVRLYQLGDGAFPPLRTISNSNLPRPASQFVGRERELAELGGLVRRGARLVTLTGPGGSGKSRLAIEVAAECLAGFRDGVFWVPLATLRDPALVMPTIANTLGARAELDVEIGTRQVLLVIDNLEQVIAAATGLARLLETCPNLVVLVTSRELLRVRGEVEYEVLPLAANEAVDLFTLRANLAQGDVVDEICRRLDNMPLAIELAAARVKLLSVDQILERLGNRLDLLRGGRDSEPRQRTLRATIEWSHDLLSADEQTAFRRLSVFAGCTATTAEEVTEADLDTLQSLVEKSLVRRTGDRLWMLETLREFATERLEGSGEAGDIRRRHAEHFLAVAHSAHLSLAGTDTGPMRHELVLPDQDNLRAAIDWATEHDVELGLRLADALENFWVTHDANEGIRRFEALLDRADGVELGLLANVWRDYGGSLDVMERRAEARAAYTRSRDLFEEDGDESGVADAEFRLGICDAFEGNRAAAVQRWRRSLGVARRVGPRRLEVECLGLLGDQELFDGDPASGREMVEQSLAIAREIGWRWWEIGRHRVLGRFAVERSHDAVEAERRATTVLDGALSMEDRNTMLWALAALAWAAGQRAETDRAARLWATVEAEPRDPGRFGRFDFDLYRPAVTPFAEPRLSLLEAAAYALKNHHSEGAG